ncbi:hypothetical protein GCM10025768_21960 [Microbacterium pseudoresistens]|uniref:SRPBCC family protein n=1 Tax=Microbacterium pseudoresistens TaxID=640634 RepID=A0A7Y9ET55_9MICO|nr:hypothetical protein [Microbacterium pseudoresistens]NYD53492.1 hypothetical protein [Microbacterium pseudoresistens]
MRILLKLSIDTDADAAWRALHSQSVLTEFYGPLVRVEALDAAEARVVTVEPDPRESAAVQLRLFGVIPIGRQLISVSDRQAIHRGVPVRILRDSGIPLSGPLASLDVWDHQMAVSPDPRNPSRTMWRDRLVIGGPTAALLWPLLWAVWQWRAARIRRLAPTWAQEPVTPQLQDG